MKPETEKAFWEELKLLQSIVNKFDDFSFRIKNWFFTIFAALTGYAVVKEEPSLVALTLGVVAIFYVFEATYRVSHADFIARLREVQTFLREGRDPEPESAPPNLDKNLLIETETTSDNWLMRLQGSWGVPELRAKRNVREWRKIFVESRRLLFQFRFSLPYLVAGIVSVFAFILAL
jgi:hypothetical protein